MTWSDVTGGWLGMTDKYWAATLIPDQSMAYTGRYIYSDSPTPLYQADYRGTATSIAPGATTTETSRAVRRRQGGQPAVRLSRQPAISRSSTC